MFYEFTIRDPAHDKGFHTIVISSGSESRALAAAKALLSERGANELMEGLTLLNRRKDNGGTCVAYEDIQG